MGSRIGGSGYPGRHWAPAWVSWAVGPGYVGWSPLGWNDQPVFLVLGRPSMSPSAWGGWTVVGTEAFVGSHRARPIARRCAPESIAHVLGAFVTQRVPPRFGSTVGASERRARPGYGAPGYGAPGYVAPPATVLAALPRLPKTPTTRRNRTRGAGVDPPRGSGIEGEAEGRTAGRREGSRQ